MINVQHVCPDGMETSREGYAIKPLGHESSKQALRMYRIGEGNSRIVHHLATDFTSGAAFKACVVEGKRSVFRQFGASWTALFKLCKRLNTMWSNQTEPPVSKTLDSPRLLDPKT